MKPQLHLTAACAAALLLSGALSSAKAESVAAPHAIAPKAGSRLLESVAARGFQIYECRADSAAPGGAKWVFVAPDAELFDSRGARVGKHYAGPHWEAIDGSKVVAEVAARADAPQADAIPWLLLSARKVAEAQGRFAQVTSIQRVNTVGGAMPGKACDASAAGKKELVPYTADYLLYGS
jgi:hypothetical protein